jgi:hypothetical protein
LVTSADLADRAMSGLPLTADVEKLIVGQARIEPRIEMLKPKTPSLCERRNLF